MFEATKIIHQNSDWITLVLVFVFSVLAMLNFFYKDRLYFVSTFFFFQKHLSILYNKDKKNLFTWFQVAFFISQILTLSLLFYLGNLYFQIAEKQLKLNDIFLLFVAVGLYFGARYAIGFLLAFLFNFKKEFLKIAYQKTSYMNHLILWILPFLVLSIFVSHYNKLFLEITLLIFLLLLLLRYTLILLNNKKLIFNNLFYFILYICALEMAPLIIILKLTI